MQNLHRLRAAASLTLTAVNAGMDTSSGTASPGRAASGRACSLQNGRHVTKLFVLVHLQCASLLHIELAALDTDGVGLR
ncbi:hypothetical protein EYF80_049248 [Liparis tanakae]|uniref:Uncharacterized protein n=1 Tax=Liparis tanakae TaxID=230148 RepID=A0A4Z2FHE9_9TELE|nr:hypothetical protein EYF80_049248 [Liparis tanakae]